ncbi:MAG: S24/S26 family peptidase [Candidatus Omnitrophota bacterium]|jgi:hypothetical protein
MSKVNYDFDAINNQGLILQLFELGRLFVDKKTVVFRATGICMYPCILPGDILHLETKSLKEINAGDIVVYRRSNRLFSHRAISKINDAGVDYLLTRPDKSWSGSEEAVADADILGIVVKIERKGKFIATEKKACSLLRKCLYNIDYGRRGLKQRASAAALEIICFLQGFKVYRVIAKALFSLYYRKLQLSLRVPLNGAVDLELYRIVPPSEFPELKAEIKDGRVARAKVVAAVNKKNIACMDLTFKSGTGPPTSVISAKIRYRHSGIEEKISGYACELLKHIYNAA